MSQNIYNNKEFFEKYKKLRENVDNYNNLVEQPIMSKLLPNLNNKMVLDLGCGYGNNCMDFIRRGAKKVIGIDISSKMLEVARHENYNEHIEYIEMDISNISKLPYKFDFVYSSLAFHYVEDFKKLIKDIQLLLNAGGFLLYSQEHPYTTAPKSGPCWTKDELGNKLYFNLSHYMYSGKREITWFLEGVTKYHRTLSEIINTLIEERYTICEVVEPIPNEIALRKRPDFIDEFHKTTCIIFKVKVSKNNIVKEYC